MSVNKEQLAIEAWLNVIIEQSPSCHETAIKYNYKRIFLHTHSTQGYYQIQVPQLAQSETIATQVLPSGNKPAKSSAESEPTSEAGPAQPLAQSLSQKDIELRNVMEMNLPQRLLALSHTISVYSPATQGDKLDFII